MLIKNNINFKPFIKNFYSMAEIINFLCLKPYFLKFDDISVKQLLASNELVCTNSKKGDSP